MGCPVACSAYKILPCDDTSGDVYCVDDKKSKAGAALIAEYRLGAPTEVHWLSVNTLVADPENRDGECVKVDEVLSKAEGIEAQGFQFTKVRVVAVQLPLSAPARKTILDRNTTWHNEDRRYPTFVDSEVEFSLIGGTHLCTFLKMVKQGIECPSFISAKPRVMCHRMEGSCKQNHFSSSFSVLRLSLMSHALSCIHGFQGVPNHHTDGFVDSRTTPSPYNRLRQV